MLASQTLYPNLSVNVPQLSFLVNSIRQSSAYTTSSSNRYARNRKPRGSKSSTALVAMYKASAADLQVLYEVMQYQKVEAQKLLAVLMPDCPFVPRLQATCHVSSPTFYENKTGFPEQSLNSDHCCLHYLASYKSRRLLGAQNIGCMLLGQRRELSTLTGMFDKFRKKTAGFGLNKQKTDDRSMEKDLKAIESLLHDADKETQMKINSAFLLGVHDKNYKKSGGGLDENMFEKLKLFAMFFTGCVLTVTIIVSLIPHLVGQEASQWNEVQPDLVNVTFADVKGCDEVKEELQDIVDYLVNVEKYQDMGAKLPKGLLMVGSPGVGKTLLAKATAGEANVPFFSVKGSEFDELYVGVGAKRMRELFANAKKKAPCIVFIDEIDSVGSKRTSSHMHPYANQTINQLLAEMDGFTGTTGVIVIAATNLRENLDKALLRSGRFDQEVTVLPPDIKGREEILDLYLSQVKHEENLELKSFAKTCQLMTGADLSNIVNQAALYAAKLGEIVAMRHLEYAKDKVMMGPLLKNKQQDEKALLCTSYHEAGHALVAHYTKHASKVHKITILARGHTLGYTETLSEDTPNISKCELLAQIDVCMGGRVAEELIYGKDYVNSGASSDLNRATKMATQMVTELGMSDKVGLRTFANPQQTGWEYSSHYQTQVDNEIERILNESYERAVGVMKAHERELHNLAKGLMEHETLNYDEMKLLMKGKKLNKPTKPIRPIEPKPTEPSLSKPVAQTL